MASFYEIEKTVSILKNDTDLNKEFISNGIPLSSIHNDEYFAMAELLLNNNDSLVNNSVEFLFNNSFLKSNIIEIFRIGQSDRPGNLSDLLYKQFFYTYKYSSIRNFFVKNYRLFIPDFDYQTINSNEKMRLLQEAFMREFDRFAQNINDLYDIVDIDKIPDEYLRYLGALIGFEKEDFQLISDISFRELLKNIIEIYRIKGTNFCLELFINFLGFNVELNELWFDKRFYDSNILVNPYNQSTNKTAFAYYLTPTKPTDYIPEGATGKFNKIILEEEITETLSQERFEDFIKNRDYTVEQLIKEDIGYKDKHYTYFKTNIISYSITSLLEEDTSILTNQNLDTINFYIKLFSPIFIKSSILFSQGISEPERTEIILNFAEEFLDSNYINYIGGEHLNTQEGLERIYNDILSNNPSLSREQVGLEIDKRIRNNVLFNKDFIERDLLILKSRAEGTDITGEIKATTFKTKPKLSNKFNLGEGREKRFSINSWTLNSGGKKEISSISSNRIVISDLTKDWDKLNEDDYITITQNEKKGVYKVSSASNQNNSTAITLENTSAISGIQAGGFILKNERAFINSNTITTAGTEEFNMRIVIRDPQKKFWSLKVGDKLQIIGDLKKIYEFVSYGTKGNPNVTLNLKAKGNSSTVNRALFLQKYTGGWAVKDELIGIDGRNNYIEVYQISDVEDVSDEGFADIVLAPNRPANFNASSGDTYITLTWNTPAFDGGDSVISFRVDFSSNGTTFTTLAENIGDTTYTHSGLSSGDTYYYRIYSVNTAGTSTTYIEIVSSVSGIPNAPTDFTSTSDSSSTIELSWMEPNYDGGSSITAYKLNVSTNGTAFTTLVASQAGTTYTHSSLSAGDTRFYRVYAINSIGTSTTYAEINQTTDNIPNAPTNFAATSTGDTSIKLSWDPPSYNGGDTITGYRITVSTNGTTFTTLVASQAGTMYTHGGLSSGDSRWYRAYAINSVGTSTTYASGNNTTLRIPTAPRNLSVSTGDTSITLSWDPPNSNGGSAITGYKIDVSTDGVTFTSLVASHGDTYYEHTGLSAGDTRFYRVYASSSVGTSTNYVENNATLTATPDEPSGLVVDPGSSSITLSWNPPVNTGGLAITGYKIDVSTDGITFITLVASHGDTSYEHTGLNVSDERWYRVYTINSIETSIAYASGNATILTIPSGPRGVSISVGDTSIILQWVVPVTDGGSPITGYRIDISTSGTSFTTLVASQTGTIYAINDTDEALYTVNASDGTAARVHATNTFGTGVWRSLSSHNGILYAINDTDNALYTVDASDGTVTRVHATNTFGTGGWRSLSSHNGTLYAVNDTNNALYTVNVSTGTATRVHATNTFGTGVWNSLASHSGTLYAVNDTNEALYTVDTSDGTATRVHANNTLGSGGWRSLGSHSGTLYAVNDTNEALYTVDASDGTASRVHSSNTLGSGFWYSLGYHNGTMYTHEGLSPGDTVWYRVYAINSVGTSTFFSPGRGTTSGGVITNTAPSAPQDFNAISVGEATRITLSWSSPSDNGGDTVTGYRIDVSTDGITFITLVASHGDTSYEHAGLVSGDKRWYRVYAINSVGASTDYDSGSATTGLLSLSDWDTAGLNTLSSALIKTGAIPTYFSIPPRGSDGALLDGELELEQIIITRILNDNNTQIVLNHNTTSSTFADYFSVGSNSDYVVYFQDETERILLSSVGSVGSRFVRFVLDTQPLLDFFSRVNISNGRLIISFVNIADGAGGSSDESSGDSVPSPPKNLRYESSGDTSIELLWEPPDYNGGDTITGYRIDFSSDNTNFIPLVASHGDTSYEHAGLSAGDTYYYKIYALNIHRSSRSYASIVSRVSSAPYISTNLIIKPDNDGEAINLNWDPPSYNGGDTVTGYKIDASTDGTTFTNLVVSQTPTYYQHGELSSGDTYYYRIYSINSIGISTDYASGNATVTSITISDTPTNLIVESDDGDSAINLNWDPPFYNGGDTITGYRIDVSTDGTIFTNLVVSQTPTYYQHGELNSGDIFWYRIYSVNSIGISTDYASGSSTVGEGSLGPPRNLTFIKGDTSIELIWNEPNNDGGDTVTGYRIDVSEDNSIFTTLVTSHGDTSYEHVGLSAGDTRYYRVYAINSVGTSVGYTSGSSTVLNIPTSPINLSLAVEGDTSIELSWDPPSNNGGTVITGYRIDVSSNSVIFYALVASQIETTYAHTGLSAGAKYYRIYAINSVGTSTTFASGSQSIEGEGGAGGAGGEGEGEGESGTTLDVPDAPENLLLESNGDTSIELTWSEPTDDGGDTITGYRIDVSSNDSSYTTLVTSQGDTHYEHTGLSGGDSRWYRVYAINSTGTSTDYASGNATTLDLPNAPENLSFEVNGDTSIELIWDEPLNVGGDSITGYKIDVSSDNSVFTNLVASNGDTSYEHIGLSAGDTRWYRIYAINSEGISVDYVSGNETTWNVPGAPTNATLTDLDDSILLRWSPPLYNGGDTVIWYRIDISVNGDSFTTLVASQGDTSYSHTDLIHGDSNCYRVYAINSVGISTNYVDMPHLVMTIFTPDAPENLTATMLGDTSIYLVWSEPTDSGGDSISGYKIDVSADGIAYSILESSHGDTSYTHTGLSGGDTRFYRVYSINSVGTSFYIADYATILGVPDAPENLSVIATGDTSIELLWSIPLSNGGVAITGYKIDVSTNGSSFTNLVASHGDTSYEHTGLSAGDTRFYRVYAINSIGTSTDYASGNNTTHTIPNAPTELNINEQTPGSAIILTWIAGYDGGDSITGYRIDASSDLSTYTTLVTTSNGDTTYTDNQSFVGIRYYRVYAINNEGTSSNYISENTLSNTPPGEISSLTLSSNNTTEINLSWVPPVNDGGDTVTGYRIDVSTDETTFTNLVASQIEISYEHTGLSAGDTRWYRVYAINNIGTSNFYIEENATTELDQTPSIESISDITISHGSSFSVTLPEATGGNGDITYQLNGNPSWASFSSTSRRLNGTSAGDAQTYSVTYYASDEDGDTSSINFDIIVNVSAPSAPVNAATNAPGTRFIRIVWDPPDNNGGDTSINYRIRVSSAGEGSGFVDTETGYGDTEFIYRGDSLFGGDTRWFRIYAVNDAGESTDYIAVNETTSLILILDDFNTEGLESDILGLIETGDSLPLGDSIIYAIPPRGDVGSLLDGNLDLGVGDTSPITRIRIKPTNDFTFNENSGFIPGNYFNNGSPGDDLTVRVLTVTEELVREISGNINSVGGGWINIDLGAVDGPVVRNINAGERFILALTRPAT